jgi:branched-subunit amino acid aminotransferase/4-amino-4-deoxychorismate lyase
MSQIAWVAGRFLSYEEAQLDSAGWPNGTGIFETIKTVDGQPWALSRHMRRALNSARRSDQPFPNEDSIRSAVAETIAANPYSIGRLRLLFGVDGTLRVTHEEYLEIVTPAKLGIRHITQAVLTPVEKRYPYSQNLQTLADAKSAGFDDYILINQDGFISETAIANLVFQVEGEWITPPLSDGVLPGVMRALLVEKNRVIVRQIRADQSFEIVAGFVVSSMKIAQPIGQIGDRMLAISPESEQMRSSFAATALATSVG